MSQPLRGQICSLHHSPSHFKPVSFFFKTYIVLLMLLRLSHFPSFTPLHPATPHIPPPHSSWPWVIQISSLASTFPILFLTSPCLFSNYHVCYLFSVHFPRTIFPFHFPTDNPPCDLHFCSCSSCLLSLFLFF